MKSGSGPQFLYWCVWGGTPEMGCGRGLRKWGVGETSGNCGTAEPLFVLAFGG